MNSFETIVDRPFDDVETEVRAALAVEGFGILTEIDVAATLAAKLDVVRPAMRILGACNPLLLNRALNLDPSASLLIPCNVVIEETKVGVRVAVVDPRELLSSSALVDLADEAAARIRRAVESIAAPRPT